MADPRQEPDNTAYSEPPRFAPPERRKPERSGAVLAIGAALLFIFGVGVGGYFIKSAGVSRAAAPAAEARAVPIFQSRAAAPAPSAEAPLPAPADASADRMMPVVPTSDRMMYGNQQEDESAPTTPALKPTHLPTAVTSKSIKPPNSIDLSIKNPRGYIEAVVVEINDLQTNRYAIQAMPDQKLSIPLPDLPVFQIVYKLVTHNGMLITKDTASFLRDGTVWVSPTQVHGRGAYTVSATYVGPFHLKRQE